MIIPPKSKNLERHIFGHKWAWRASFMLFGAVIITFVCQPWLPGRLILAIVMAVCIGTVVCVDMILQWFVARQTMKVESEETTRNENSRPGEVSRQVILLVYSLGITVLCLIMIALFVEKKTAGAGPPAPTASKEVGKFIDIRRR